ncbi:MAG TPA: glycosyl hydrolase family 28-related protein, partial [Verrucomicrobiae bacterium]|nr:glycosyl hydrolase family 28-related protein [Verrucomicrobiae bacterium]
MPIQTISPVSNRFIATISAVVLFASVISDVANAQSSFVAPALPAVPDEIYNITNYGAVGDDMATNTIAIQATVQAASAAGGGTVEVPAGVYLSGPIQLASRIRLQLDEGAILRMLPLGKYPGGTRNPADFLRGAGLQDVAISGAGMIDGQGIPWWPYARVGGARRPRMIAMSSCERVLI